MHKNIFLLSYLSAPPLSFFIPHKHQIFICFSLFWGVSPECPKSPVLREGRPWSHPQTSPKQLPWVPVVVQLCWVGGWGGPDASGTLTWNLGQIRQDASFPASVVHRDCQSGSSQGPCQVGSPTSSPKDH